MKPHGNTGNRSASKPDKDKLPEAITFTAPQGTKERIRQASGGKIAALGRDAVAAQLTK